MNGHFALLLLASVFAPAILSAPVRACEANQQTLESLARQGMTFSKPLDFADVERKNTGAYRDKDGVERNVAFGRAHVEWEAIKAKARPGDRLHYATQTNIYASYILVRDNCVIGSLLIFRS